MLHRHDMRKLLAVAFAVPLFTACTVGEDPVADDGDEHPNPMPDPDPMPTGDGIEGTIQADTTWSGTIRIKAATTIPVGVTVTVAAGTTINFANSAAIAVQGTLRVEGTAAAKVTAQSEPGATYWGSFNTTGTLDLKYANFTGGAIYTSAPTAVVNIIDSHLYKASGDYIIMNGGTLNMTYTNLGAQAGETDATHCNLHINAASSITVTNNNINNAPFGIMFYGGVNANFQNNNWYGASLPPVGANVATQSGVSGNFSGGYFQGGAPCSAAQGACPGATITANNLSATMLPATMVGPRP
jgi:hypothetical protein